MQFLKMHGLGNDFVMVDCLDKTPWPLEKMGALSQAVCAHHFGVGGDGLILILPDDTADYRMRMWNPDGSESEMCGNGIRCFGKYLYDKGLVGADEVSVATSQGLQRIEIREGGARGANPLPVRVDMGTPRLRRSQIPMLAPANATNGQADGRVVDEPLEVEGENGEIETYRVTGVSMGNPHCVIFVDDVEAVPLKELGLRIEHHAAFPQRVNVHFVKALAPHKLWMRTWERGAGDTLACGTGACAVTVAACLNGFVPAGDRRARVQLPGGDLDIEWAPNDHVYMTGPAVTVFEGTLDEAFLRAVR